MEIEEKESLRQAIQEKIEIFKRRIETFKNLSKPVSPDNAIGRLTRMEAINSKGINEAALAKSKQTLSRLQESFEMIDDPDFGYCRNCEEPIPFKRLLIMPESLFCVLCAGKIDPCRP